MFELSVAAPLASVLTVPLAGQRSWVVRYWTVAQTWTPEAGLPSWRRLTTMLSNELGAGVGLETATLEPSKRCARSGEGVAVGAAVLLGAGVRLLGVAARGPVSPTGTMNWSALSPDRLNDTCG